MKHKHLLLSFCVLLSACAKKTLLIDSNTFSHQIKTSTDTSIQKTTSTTDKTITFINRSIDTNIVFTGQSLSGYLIPSKWLNKDTSAHFENDDLELILQIDRVGNATATAIPRRKTIKANAFERIAVYNDITKTENTKIEGSKLEKGKTSFSTQHIEKETKGNSSIGFNLFMVVLLVVGLILLVRKIGFLGRLFG
ncbi:hypothetical protein ACFQZS_05910 [Mucilaginibacter calamicampi]|uniref:Lipoprotein n=1 Tax=Mucilaginibacter calamicampi TaxID=1302352 RepID=A0ABW2YWC3_9SPHI